MDYDKTLMRAGFVHFVKPELDSMPRKVSGTK